MINDSIARNRLGLGARPDDQPVADPLRWLLAQLDDYEPLPVPWRSIERTSKRAAQWTEQQAAIRNAPEAQRASVRADYQRAGRAAYLAGVEARTNSALQSSTPFVERLVHFWANHFAISVDKVPVLGFAASFEADAIRPHVLGRFEDLLLATARHPAMLLYLDQSASTGPDSVAARRASAKAPDRPTRGLNENLAREILELHTLGVRSGYTQADVLEFARALTGWTLPGQQSLEDAEQTFRFQANQHEPGVRTVLGRSYADDGQQQATAILRDLARAPATASHIATKLARHFITDDPPPALVKRLAERFLQTGGDLPALYRELVSAAGDLPPVAAKFKSPWDWTLSGLRAMGVQTVPAARIQFLMARLGQPVWRPGSPAGYGDVTATWAAPDALLRRVEIAQRLATEFGSKIDARALAPRVLPGTLSGATATAIAQAESPANALALLLASPEFLRR
ncbi:DUF1800 domain-containing protein [Oxalobacteraceae sp. CFBP 8753]|nr:DUF1800 domain-containing protein [Oxalobacteraceae sp. CFBP 8753]